MGVEPVPDAPAATVDLPNRRLLVIADYHAGIESVLRSDGIEIGSQAEERRQRLVELIDRTAATKLVILGDLAHTIGHPWTVEREEIEALLEALSVPVTLVKGNHDGEIESVLAEIDHDITVTDTRGIRLGNVGFVHGHTWPSKTVLAADIVCVGHEHPVVRLTDEVGGSRIERVWLRGTIVPAAFEPALGELDIVGGELVVFPAFNDLSGGTWINVPDQEFLAPFLPDGLENGEAYLLNGTRLGPYRSI